MRRGLRTGFLAALLAGAAVATAQTPESLRSELEEQGFTLRADRVDYDRERELYEASGNVHVEQPSGRRLRADWLTFSPETRTGVATGDVELVDGDDVVRAQFAAVDLDSLTALLTDAELVAGRTGYVLEAESLERTGPATYRAEDCTITTCRCAPGERRPFEVDAGRAEVRVGGYAVAHDVLLRLLGFPVAYTPFLVLPVKTERQTGLLPPRLGGSERGGTEVEVPFFWAARPNLNLLLRPGFASHRGLRAGLDFETVFGETGWSEGGGEVLPGDDEVSRDDPDTRFSDDRYALWLRHEQPLGPGLRLGADLLKLSDNSYPLDFDGRAEEARQLRFTTSHAWGAGVSDSLFGTVALRAYDDLQSPNDLDRDRRFLQRLPDVRLTALPRTLPLGLDRVRLRGALDFRYTYFHQEDHSDLEAGSLSVREQFFDTGADGLFDAQEPDLLGGFPGIDSSRDNFADPTVPRDRAFEGDGVFQEGEPLADRGHRIELYPRLVLPGRLGPIEGLGEIGYRQGLYFPRHGHSETRELWTARIDARTRLERTYGTGGGLRHVVEPALGGVFVSRQQQADNPLFVPRGAVEQGRILDADLRARLRSPTDRIPDQRLVLAAVTNRFFRTGTAGEPARQLAELRLGSGYDFEEDRLRNVFLEGEMEPFSDASLEVELGYDPKDDELDEALARLHWSGTAGHGVDLSYRYLRDIPRVFETFPSSDVFDEADPDFDRVNQLAFQAEYVLTRRLQVFGGLYHSFEDSRSQSRSVGVRIRSSCDCWELEAGLSRRTRPRDTRIRLEIRIAGLGLEPAR